MLIPDIAPAKLFATVPAKLDRVVSIAYEAPGRERREREKKGKRGREIERKKERKTEEREGEIEIEGER